MRVLSFCISTSINSVHLEARLRREGLDCRRYFDVVYVSEPGAKGLKRCFYLKNGTVIMWNISKIEKDRFLEYARASCEETVPGLLEDSYVYTYGEKFSVRPHRYFNVDILVLTEDDFDLIFALTHAFSLSIKLRYHERQIKKLITEYTPIIKQQAKTGKLNIKREKANRIIGEILEIKSLINLQAMFIYPPPFLWDYPGLEQHYQVLQLYLDISKRHDILNNQLNTLTEVFELLGTHLQNKHSHFLEVIIIVLIGLEIIFNVFNLHLIAG